MIRKIVAGSARAQALDSWGREVFSAGDAGAVHVRAHALLDRGFARRGHKELGNWLATHTDAGSAWVHLQFHMGLFELAIGDWRTAYRRWCRELLPAAHAGDAATDAPGLLWRLALTAPEDLSTAWQQLRPAALAGLSARPPAFVELHHLLALAGAEDARSIIEWRAQVACDGADRREPLLDVAAEALLAIAERRPRDAAGGLARLLPRLPSLGGSRAQLELFTQLLRWCRRPAVTGSAERLAA